MKGRTWLWRARPNCHQLLVLGLAAWFETTCDQRGFRLDGLVALARLRTSRMTRWDLTLQREDRA